MGVFYCGGMGWKGELLLPEGLQWEENALNGVANHFDCFLCFLKKQELILAELDQLEASP